MKNHDNITNLFQKMFISLPFLSKQASRYDKLTWTARAIHILTKNNFKFNIKNKEDIGSLESLLLKYFREKKIEKFDFIKPDDKRKSHLLEHNSLREFVAKFVGLLSNFFPYINLLVEYDCFKDSTEYKEYFTALLNEKDTINLYYDLSLFNEYSDNPFIDEVISFVYKAHAQNYYYYDVYIKDNKIHWKQKQIQNDSHFEKLKLSYYQSCIAKLDRIEVRETAYLDINTVLETRLQRLSVKKIKYDHFQNKIDFDLYYKKVLEIFQKYQLLDLTFKHFNVLSLIKFISSSKMRFYRANKEFCSFYEPFDTPIKTIFKEQPQVLLVGSRAQGTGKTSFVQNLFFSYLQKHICASLNPQIGADVFNKKFRQQDISFKHCKDFIFTYLGDIKDFNMDILKDVTDRDKITYTRLYSDKGVTHNTSLNFFGTLNTNFQEGGLKEKLITQDYDKHRRLVFCIASEKQVGYKEKMWFDTISKTQEFKDDMDFIMSFCPVGWDWMMNHSHDDILDLVKEHDRMQESFQTKNSKKNSELEWIEDLFDFFDLELVPVLSLYRLAKEKYGYKQSLKAFGMLLSKLKIERKKITIEFYNRDKFNLEYIKQDVDLSKQIRFCVNPFFKKK